jgi:hypothetical protein
MRTKKSYAQAIKRIYRPEILHCLTCQTRLRRCLTTSQPTVVTLQEVVRVVHGGYRCPNTSCSDQLRLYRSAGTEVSQDTA